MRLILIVLAIASVPLISWSGESCNWSTNHDCPWQCWTDKHEFGGSTQPGDNVTITSGPNSGLAAANSYCAAKRGGNGIPIRNTAVGGIGAVVFADDYEDPAYTDHTAASRGWADSTGSACVGFSDFRGCGAAWYEKYGEGDSQCSIFKPFPSSPTYGPSCCNDGSGTSCSGGSNKCATPEYTAGTQYPVPADRGGGYSGACIDIFNGTTEPNNQESSSLGIPDCPGADGLSGTADDEVNCGPFDGNQSFAMRWPAGCGVAGALGGRSFGSKLTTIGVTFAAAFPDDHATSTLDDFIVKFDEYDNGVSKALCSGAPCSEFWLMSFYSQYGAPTPLGGLLFTENEDAMAASATNTIGSITSRGEGSITNIINVANFNRATDWPYGTWGCVQAKFSGMGTTNTRLEKWFNGTKILDVTFNGTLAANDGYSRFFYNGYSNQAQDNCGTGGINQLSRFERDNYVITDGAPVPCSEIGSSIADTSSPYPGSEGSGTFTISEKPAP